MESSENASLVAQVSALLSRASAAHSEYEKEALKGVRDEEWPSWYAEFLRENGLPALLYGSAAGEPELGDAQDLVANLDKLLAAADESHRANAPDERWEDYYARYLVKRVSGGAV